MRKLIMKVSNYKKLISKKKGFIVCVILFLIFVLSLLYFVKSNLFFEKNHTIVLTDHGFQPNNITVRYGDTVKFKTDTKRDFWPASNIHPTHEIYTEFDPKRPLSHQEEWSFTFTKPGIWKFHDHIFANSTGTIVVLAEDGSKPLAQTECDNLPKNELAQCWDQKLEETIRLEGLEEGFEMFVTLYNTNPDIPKACHGWAHVLGKAGYDLYKQDKNFILKPEISYCGYGFMHGFIEQLLIETGDPKSVRDFCKYASNSLPDSGATYSNCLHGIGHGSVDVEDENKWGNFDEMLAPGIQKCESILTNPSELRLCYDGTYNAMQQYENKNEYQLSVDFSDLFRHCRNIEEVYKVSCHFEYIGLISAATGHDFTKAAALFLAENPNDESGNYGFGKMAADFMQEDIVNDSWKKNIEDCHKIPDKYYDSCFRGILNGFMAHGLPGKEHERGLLLCKADYLTKDERNKCYAVMASQIEAGSPACRALDSDYQHHCRRS